MLRELEAFCRERRALFYPKADLPIADELLRGLPAAAAAQAPQHGRIAAHVCAEVMGQAPVAVRPLGVPGTFHVLYRAAFRDGRAVIVRLNALSEQRRDFLLCLDPWVCRRLRAERLPALEIHHVDVERRLCPWDFQLLQEAPGRPLTLLDDDEGALQPLLFQLGRFVARLHAIRMRGFGFLDVRPLVLGEGDDCVWGTCARWRHHVLRRLDAHVEHCAAIGVVTAGESQRILAAFLAAEDLLDDVEPVLLHGDLGSHNVFTDGHKITALIDWEDCLSGDAVFDIAFWATFHPERRHPAFLKGYQAEHPLPRDFERRFWLYFLRVALAKTVLRHRLGLTDRPGRPPASLRIQKGLERVEALERPHRLAAVLGTARDRDGASDHDGCALLRQRRNEEEPVTPEHQRLADLARRVRAHTLRMVHRAKASHVGSCFSMTDLLAVLYGAVLRVDPARPDWDDRDRFVLSKGHGAAAIYATLAECGFFPVAWLDTYCADGSRLAGHISHHGVPGVEVSSGSLGHGLSLACGMALAGQRDGRTYRVFALLSDGECDEGSVWEAALFAAHHRLDNLVVLVDYNKIQSFGIVKEVLGLEPFAAKWQAFGWAVREIDGHDIGQILDTLRAVPFEVGRPSVVLAHTVKGKGVSFMEDRLLWHYRSPDGAQLEQALAELGCGT
jgi:transketolase